MSWVSAPLGWLSGEYDTIASGGTVVNPAYSPSDYAQYYPNIDYCAYIPQWHQKPKFRALIRLLTFPFDQNRRLALSMPKLFDVDYAVGDQLDKVAEWVGLTRKVSVQSNNSFSFDVAGLGWDQGWWQTGGYNNIYFAFDTANRGWDQGLWQDLIPNDYGNSPSPYFSFDTAGSGWDGGLWQTNQTGFGSSLFAFDIPSLGWDSGWWAQSPNMYNPPAPSIYTSSSIFDLDDSTFRQFVKAKILLNKYDGTFQMLYEILSTAFNTTSVIIVDNNNMSIDIIVSGVTYLWLVQDLINQKYLDLSLTGITINNITLT